MDQQSLIADIERRARDVPTSIAAVCKRAGVHPTTFSRWKRSNRNPEPISATLATLQKLDQALREMEATTRRRRRSQPFQGSAAA